MFDSEKKAEGLDTSTFDIVKIGAFHNTRFWTVLSYSWVWIIVILKVVILAGDTYTCVSILIFNKWSTLDYDVYEYKVAKWIFTGCIFFRFLLLAYQMAWGIHIYRTRNIALAYLNNYARLMYVVRSYDYQCLFHDIDQEGFFEGGCFLVYTELDNALEVLVADLPRQVINFMTLRYYATGGEHNNDILGNIKSIATTNLRLSIILSFQLCTMLFFLFFFFKFLLAIILYTPIKVKVAHKGFRLLKAFCYRSVNDNVRYLVKRNHKSRTQILHEGILDLETIKENSLLSSSSTSDIGSWPRPNGAEALSHVSVISRSSSRIGLHDRALGAISLDQLPSKDSISSVRKPPLQSHGNNRLRENPFSDCEAGSMSNWAASVDKDELDPFGDTSINLEIKTARIRSLLRSHSSESLMSRPAAGNAMMLSTSDIYCRKDRTQISGSSHWRYESDSQLDFVNDSSSSMRSFLTDCVDREGSARADRYVTSGDKQISHTLRIYRNGLLTQSSSIAEFHDTQQPDHGVLYPVRGVSQYFADHRDV